MISKVIKYIVEPDALLVTLDEEPPLRAIDREATLESFRGFSAHPRYFRAFISGAVLMPAYRQGLSAVLTEEQLSQLCVNLPLVRSRDRQTDARAIAEAVGSGRRILFQEPATDGFDLTWVSAKDDTSYVLSLIDRLADQATALYHIPYRQIRSENAFNFERYDLDRFGNCLVERPYQRRG